MQTISNGQDVRLSTWDQMACGTVYTLHASCDGDEELIQRQLDLHNHPLAWVTYAGMAITSSRAFYDQLRDRVAAALVLEEGEWVLIDGVVYRVVVAPGNHTSPRNSDPVTFVKVG